MEGDAYSILCGYPQGFVVLVSASIIDLRSHYGVTLANADMLAHRGRTNILAHCGHTDILNHLVHTPTILRRRQRRHKIRKKRTKPIIMIHSRIVSDQEQMTRYPIQLLHNPGHDARRNIRDTVHNDTNGIAVHGEGFEAIVRGSIEPGVECLFEDDG